jgi:hypothetical protein
MIYQPYATTWAPLGLKPQAFSASIQGAGASPAGQPPSAWRTELSPEPTPNGLTDIGPAWAGGPPPIRKGSPWELLPLIGGKALDLAPTDKFCRPDFLRRYQPGATTLVYSAGCFGLRALAESLRLLIFKIGTHGGSDLSIRMQRLDAAQYAGLRQSGGDDYGFASWLPEPIQPRFAECSPESPVVIRTDALEIVLPFGLKNAKFDRQLNRALCSASLESFARSRAGEGYCYGRDVDPASLFRASRGDKGQLESATELVLFRPYQDLQRLVRVCEDLIYQHVMDAPATN